MEGQEHHAQRGYGSHVRAGERAQEPSEPRERDEGSDPALGSAGPADQSAGNQRPPNNEIDRAGGDALTRPSEPFRSEPEHDSGGPCRPEEAPTKGGQALTRREQRLHYL
jgi:hypothetical protein